MQPDKPNQHFLIAVLYIEHLIRENIGHSCTYFIKLKKHSLGNPWMADINCSLCISRGVIFIHRIIVTSAGNKVGRETWLMVIYCQTFVRLIGSVGIEGISGELLAI